MSLEKEVVQYKGGHGDLDGAASTHGKNSLITDTVEEVGPVTAVGVPDSHR